MTSSTLSRVSFLVLILAVPAASAAEPHRISLSSNPLPFLLQGYDVGVGYIAPAVPRLRLYATHHAIGGFPSFIPSNPEWNTLIRAYTLNGQYYWNDGGRGWFLGGQVALTTSTVTRPDTPGESGFAATVDVGAAAGYRWFPFEAQVVRGLFLMPWARIGASFPVTSPAVVGGVQAPGGRWWNITPLLHLGYEFEL